MFFQPNSNAAKKTLREKHIQFVAGGPPPAARAVKKWAGGRGIRRRIIGWPQESLGATRRA